MTDDPLVICRLDGECETFVAGDNAGPVRHSRTVRLPYGYSATFVWTSSLRVIWDPAPPRIRSRRAWRKFQAAYFEARDEFLGEAMTMTGQTIAVVTPGAARELTIIGGCQPMFHTRKEKADEHLH